MPKTELRTYLDALAQYHLHPEAKFKYADYTDAGTTERRQVSPLVHVYIGKEANDLEIQFYLGMEEERAIIYGASRRELKRLQSLARRKIRLHGVRAMARTVGMSTGLLSMMSRRLRNVRVCLAARMLQAPPWDAPSL